MSGSSSTRPDWPAPNLGLIKRAFLNENGQLAVLIALIFQVLFILFAMIINIGLIIHDKINLQNAVDLGAYYGAERQAEAMNEIAHINYQIRQDYKLLTWRYRVLGAFGTHGHPANSQTGALSETAFITPGGCHTPGGCPPYVCGGTTSWKQTTGEPNSSVCFQPIDSVSPSINDLSYAGVPGGIDITGDLNAIRAQQVKYCETVTPLNWFLASSFVVGFRLSVGERKKMIGKIANDISQPDWNDALDGSVRQGIIKTISKNLTAANADASSFSASGVTIVNGLTLGGCGADENGLPHWLQDIEIEPHMPYLYLEASGSACTYKLKDFNDTSGVNTAAFDPGGFLSSQLGEPNGLAHSSRGVEKNPWCMAYIGVKAQTHPRKPFAPLGQAITMEAKSFASPFGGRIGPWDKQQWSTGAAQSSGNPVDALAVPRGTTTKSMPFDSNNPYFPNYARYPGDTLGLNSVASLGLFRDEIASAIYLKPTLSVTNYLPVQQVATTGDSLSWDPEANKPTTERSLELAAVAPDLFDATYYSVDSDYYHDFFLKRDWKTAGFAPMSDAGYRAGSDPGIMASNVINQISGSQKHADVQTYGFYLVPKPENLLTGWTQGRAVDYDAGSPSMLSRFGHCQLAVDASAGQPNVPGNCIAGGRVGYSVRIVHKAYLNSAAHALGGGDSSQGPLLNAPGELL